MDCWHHEIDKANSEAEVVRSAGDFLELWAPRHIPPTRLGLAAMRIENPDDIERVKTHLADRPATPGNVTDSHLRELADYFFHASNRVAELRRRQARPNPVPYLR